MKQAVLMSAVGLAAAMTAATANAEEVGRVISSTPVVQQVPVPRQVCSQAYVQPQPSGGGAVVGAIVGGLLGNQIGAGAGRAAATGVGAVTGALVGNNVEAGGQPPYAVPQCFTQTAYENRTVAYNVTYEYRGQQYTAQMPYDPGKTIRVQVTPAGAGDYAPPPETAGNAPPPPPADGAPPPVASSQPQGVIIGEVPTTVGPAPTYAYPAAYPVYPAYYYPRPYYYPPVSLSLGFGWFSGGHHHHR